MKRRCDSIIGNTTGTLSARVQIGVAASGMLNTTVSGNTVYNNIPLEGISIQSATNTVVRDNIVYANGTDIVDAGIGTVLSNNGRQD